MQALELKIPPLAVGLIVGTLMWLAGRVAPGLGFGFPGRHLVAMSVGAAGACIIALGIVSFRRAATTVNPMKPDTASTLVVSGIYQMTRNPMYLGFFLILIGWAIFLSNVAAFMPLPLFVLYMNRFQIEPEERALASLFGQAFESYRSSVRRWL
jgi:protein-S-isoprenylcysteine O-methyltransferase Ste14